ncbi:MAG: thiamine diphosphokinase [Roseburia sp.]
MRHFLVVSGGEIDDGFTVRAMDELRPDIRIAADSGMEFFYRTGRCPDVIVGDFDSVEAEALEFFRGQPGIEFRELNPVKDDTDTESAIRIAISMGAEQITLLGGTGSRLDHVLGNIELLGMGLKAGVPITMLDAHNRIRMVQRGIAICKEEQFGSYVSLLPYTGKVEHLTLAGFKYPLMDHCLEGFCSLGVSNEIVENRGIITFDGGILLVIESRDEGR